MKYPIGFAILYGVIWNSSCLASHMFLRSLWDSAGNVLHFIYLSYFAFDQANETLFKQKPQFVVFFIIILLNSSCDFQLCKKYFGP